MNINYYPSFGYSENLPLNVNGFLALLHTHLYTISNKISHPNSSEEMGFFFFWKHNI